MAVAMKNFKKERKNSVVYRVSYRVGLHNQYYSYTNINASSTSDALKKFSELFKNKRCEIVDIVEEKK